jgi:phage tail sheath protein FI
MTLQLLSPGVYIQEIPSGSHTIAGVATSITAFVGYLRRGPAPEAAGQAGTPVPLQNFGDFQRVFGGLDAQSETSYQVNQFFLNGGSTAWVTRAFSSDPNAQPILPTATLQGSTGKPGGGGGSGPTAPAGVESMVVNAGNPGSWGQNVFVTIDPLTTVQNGFNLYATEYSFAGSSPTTVKTTALSGVVMDRSQTNYVGTVLTNSGDPNAALIAIDDPATGATIGPVPFPTGTLLSFTAPSKPAAGLTFTLIIQPPTPPPAPGGPKPTPPKPIVIKNIASPVAVSDAKTLMAALQGVFSAAVATLPLLSSARISLAPTPPPQAGSATPATGAAQTLQISLTDPRYAGYLIGLACSASSLFTVPQTNVQAYQLQGAPAVALPDGKPPSGTDLAGNQTSRTGVYALEEVDLFNLLCLPDLRNFGGGDYMIAATSALNYCVGRRAMAILDIPGGSRDVHAAQAWVTQTVPSFGTGVVNGAAYFPEPVIPDPLNQAQPRTIGASGSLAGIYAATDQARGVWKAPAGIEAVLAGVQQLTANLSNADNGIINPYGLNALRTFTGYGNIAWGARTLAAGNEADQDWKYVSVRRLGLYIEESLYRGLKWAVFEPNDATLWAQLRTSATAFMHELFQAGAFVGMTPATAYQVACGPSTTSPDDMEKGIVNLLVRFAPVEPAEFVVVTIQQMVGQSSS